MTRILIIDDSLFQRRVIGKILQERGYDFTEASDGKDGLIHIITDKPDIVLMDLLMPEMDGYEVLRQLKEKGIEIPVIILTSDVQMSTREECMNLGARGFVNKPVHDQDLIPSIEKVISGEI